MSLEQQISELVSATNDLTNEVVGKMGSIDQRMGQAEQDFTSWRNATTAEQIKGEGRYLQDIVIGGSTDLLYPVWWQFPSNTFGVGKLAISRHYGWNGGVNERPLNAASVHQAALLLEMEGNATPWSGDANFLEIKRFNEKYNGTASHVQFGAYAFRESADGVNPPDYGPDGYNYIYSGCYLRGGGLLYRITKNWNGSIHYLDGSDPTAEVELHRYQNSKFVVRPLPWSERVLPLEDINAFVNV